MQMGFVMMQTPALDSSIPVGSATVQEPVFQCGCTWLPDGDCDCDGNTLDAIGVCGGGCAADVDGDGVCDVDELPRMYQQPRL